MYDEPEYNEYDDDEYRYYPEGGEYNEHGYPKQFKFDWNSWESWLSDAIKEIYEENNVWIFGQYSSPQKNKKYDKSKIDEEYFSYLGNNNYDEPVWKEEYFVDNELEKYYKNYLISNAKYILEQPNYYRGLFDNLN